MREIKQAEKAVTDRIKWLQRVRDRLSRARKQGESGKQMVLALESLADDLRASSSGTDSTQHEGDC